MHFIYILYSRAFDKFYIGETINVEGRLQQHNSGYYGTSSTRYTKDWQLKLFFRMRNREEALKLEKYIKSMKSKKFIDKLIDEEDFLKGFKQIVSDRFDIIIE